MQNRFDEFARALAEGMSRRQALRQLAGGAAGALLTGLSLGKAWGAGGSNTVCAQWCASIYPEGPLRDQCVSQAAQCKNGNAAACAASLCYQCGPAAPATHGALCGTSPNLVCCASGQVCLNGVCADTCSSPSTCDVPSFCTDGCLCVQTVDQGNVCVGIPQSPVGCASSA